MADEPKRVTRWLRNDNGVDYKWPTLRIDPHPAGEAMAIELGEHESVPFGFTEVEPPADETAKSEPDEAPKPRKER